MKSRSAFGVTFAAAVPLLLAGCGGGTSPAPGAPPAVAVPQTHHRSTLFLGARTHARPSDARVRGWMRRGNAPAEILYLSDSVGNFVNLYDASGTSQTPIGQIGGLNEPQGLWVDHLSDLWVANTNAQTILAFRKGHLFPYKTLTDPSGFPLSVCTTSSGTIYAPDIVSNSDGNGQTINVYAHGSTTPTSVLTDSNSEDLYFCALDSHGNLFVTMSNLENYGEIDEFPHGQTTPVVIASNLGYPGGIAFDRYNSLVVSDLYTYTIYIYDPPYTEGPAYSFTYSGEIGGIALDHTQTQLWGADLQNLLGQEFSYPHGALEDETSTQYLQYPVGAAISPAARP